MTEAKFTKAEKLIMKEIHETGEYFWKDLLNPTIERALKSLFWIEVIVRKPTYGNIFIPTSLGSKAISQIFMEEELESMK